MVGMEGGYFGNAGYFLKTLFPNWAGQAVSNLPFQGETSTASITRVVAIGLN